MSVVDSVVEAVIELIRDTKPFARVTRGQLPTKGAGLACEIGPSAYTNLHWNKDSDVILNLTLNGKHKDLQKLSNTLNDIHSLLTRRTEYPSGDAWQILDIQNGINPQQIGREASGEWLMASSLNIKFYQRGD